MTQNLADNWIMLDTDTDDANNNLSLRLLDLRAQQQTANPEIRQERYRSEDLEGITEYTFLQGRLISAVFLADDGDEVTAETNLERRDWYRKSQQDETRIS